ncbi:hypothetical protein CF394_11065 [Tetzosporium hominis]|uniref:Uncharacterized protein n=1 Tax=Tetzosporium hominis TaxID=2020506 RepID=A0A264W2C9_9BACL|nr:hypothetical protein CF394_11065 [Tetzosporium hominis]
MNLVVAVRKIMFFERCLVVLGLQEFADHRERSADLTEYYKDIKPNSKDFSLNQLLFQTRHNQTTSTSQTSKPNILSRSKEFLYPTFVLQNIKWSLLNSFSVTLL